MLTDRKYLHSRRQILGVGEATGPVLTVPMAVIAPAAAPIVASLELHKPEWISGEFES